MATPQDRMFAIAARGMLAVVVIAVSFMGYKWGLDYLLEQEKGRSRSHAADSRQLDILTSRLKANKIPETQKLSSHELQVASCIVDPSMLDVSFEDVGGLEAVKAQIHELVILPLERPELFQQRGSLLTFPKGVLLYGPPGTGKTMLAKAIAKQSKSLFLNIQTSFLMNMWYGETNKLVSAVFSLAEKIQPCVIFIDEMESFFKARGRSYESEAGSLAKTEFMALWDGLTSRPTSRIVVIGATNRPEDLDPAIIRRMPHRFEVPMPSVSQRQAILRVVLRNQPVEETLDLPLLARVTEGYSGHDLRELCRRAAQVSLRELLKAESRSASSPSLASAPPSPAPVPASASSALRGLRMSDFTEALGEHPVLTPASVEPPVFTPYRASPSPPRGATTD